MDAFMRCEKCGVVPVVVIEKIEDAAPTAMALLAGGVDVMEITLRTSAGLDSIHAVSEACPDVLVGAGTVITLEQCKKSVEAGAHFIVTPGFDAEVVAWCLDKGVAVLPGCVTPTEIMEAMRMGVSVFKFFPANVYGGLAGMKALAAPFGGIKFVPTGGVNESNLAEFLQAPFVSAVGGSWLCKKEDISKGNFGLIEALAANASRIVAGKA